MFFERYNGPYSGTGLGLDVPYSDAQGSTKTATAGTGTLCGTTGDAIALQAMLSDMGFYTGKIDGQMGPGTRSAVTAFAAAQSTDPGAYYPAGAICSAIINAYQVKHAAAPAPATPAPSLSRLLINPALIAAMAKSATPRAGTMTTGGAPTYTPAASSGGVTGWWGAQSQTTKIGIGVAAAVLLAIAGYEAFGGKPKTATPNKRRKAMRRSPSKHRGRASAEVAEFLARHAKKKSYPVMDYGPPPPR